MYNIKCSTMPKCKKCNNSFPNIIIIEGKRRNISNRKYCLDCSPFGKHNTRKIHIGGVSINSSERLCTCNICGRDFILSSIKRGSGRGSTCGSCIVTRHRQRIKIKLVNYKGGKCQSCGYNKSVCSLDFHHINPKDKEFSISGKIYSYNKMLSEVEKCILVCRNCHGEIHEDLELKGYSDIMNKILIDR